MNFLLSSLHTLNSCLTAMFQQRMCYILINTQVKDAAKRKRFFSITSCVQELAKKTRIILKQSQICAHFQFAVKASLKVNFIQASISEWLLL